MPRVVVVSRLLAVVRPAGIIEIVAVVGESAEVEFLNVAANRRRPYP